MKYCFLSVISDGANTKWKYLHTYEYYYSWNKATDKVSNGINSLFTHDYGCIVERITQLCQGIYIYPDDSKKNEAIICRYPQFAENARQYQITSASERRRKRWNIFWSNRGKTYTMLFLTRLMIPVIEAFNNPTIIIITDREDLIRRLLSCLLRQKVFARERC